MYEFNLDTSNGGIYLSHQMIDVLSLINCKSMDEVESFIMTNPNLINFSTVLLDDYRTRYDSDRSSLDAIKRDVFRLYQDSYINDLIMNEIKNSGDMQYAFHLKLSRLGLSEEKENELFDIFMNEGEGACYREISSLIGEDETLKFELFFGDDYENIKSATYEEFLALNEQIIRNIRNSQREDSDYTFVVGSGRYFNTVIPSTDPDNEIGVEYYPFNTRSGFELAKELGANVRYHAVIDANTAKQFYENGYSREEVLNLLQFFVTESLNEVLEFNRKNGNVVNVVELFNELVEYNKANDGSDYQEVWKKYFDISIEDIMDSCIKPNSFIIEELKRSGVKFMYNETLLQESPDRLRLIENVYGRIYGKYPRLIDIFADQMHFTDSDLSRDKKDNLTREFQFLKRMQDKGLSIECSEFDFRVGVSTVRSLDERIKNNSMSYEDAYRIKQRMISEIEKMALASGVIFDRVAIWDSLDNVTGSVVRENRKLDGDYLSTLYSGFYQRISNMAKDKESVSRQLEVESKRILFDKSNYVPLKIKKLNHGLDSLEQERFSNDFLLKSRDYISVFFDEYRDYLSRDQFEIIRGLVKSGAISVDFSSGSQLYEDRKKAILNDTSLSYFEKLKLVERIKLPKVVSHEGKITFNAACFGNISYDELQSECSRLLVQELVSKFINPKQMDGANNDDVRLGLVDVCSRELHSKCKLDGEYSPLSTTGEAFVKKTLTGVEDRDSYYRMIFHGSVDDFYAKRYPVKEEKKESIQESITKETSSVDSFVESRYSFKTFKGKKENRKRIKDNFSSMSDEHKQIYVSGLVSNKEATPTVKSEDSKPKVKAMSKPAGDGKKSGGFGSYLGIMALIIIISLVVLFIGLNMLSGG